jgi:N,N'-diacetyllegionaminate synthase
MQTARKEDSVIIIAEAGVNHNGSLQNAFKLIEAAKDAGADYVKFQTFKTELCISKDAPLAEYQKKTTEKVETQFDLVKKLELSEDTHFKLIEKCKECGIKFLSTGFDIPSLNFLNSLGMDFFKVPSGEITNLPYLREIAKFKKQIVLSTGMTDIQEIKDALEVFRGLDVTVLHCNTEYPTPMVDVNLKAMLTIQSELNVPIGYSDHTLGIEVPVAAVALGAKVIEKHFTLDKNMVGPDHKASLEPQELKAMVQAIRNIERALGSGVKKASPSESKNKAIARKSLVASIDIKAGEIFSADNITAKRPGTGISPMKWDDVIGKKAKRDFRVDELLEI